MFSDKNAETGIKIIILILLISFCSKFLLDLIPIIVSIIAGFMFMCFVGWVYNNYFHEKIIYYIKKYWSKIKRIK